MPASMRTSRRRSPWASPDAGSASSGVGLRREALRPRAATQQDRQQTTSANSQWHESSQHRGGGVHLDARQRGLQQSGQILERECRAAHGESRARRAGRSGRRRSCAWSARRCRRGPAAPRSRARGRRRRASRRRRAPSRSSMRTRARAASSSARSRRRPRRADGRQLLSFREHRQRERDAAQDDLVAPFALVAQAEAVVGAGKRLAHGQVGVGLADRGLERAQLGPLLRRTHQAPQLGRLPGRQACLAPRWRLESGAGP